MESTEFYLHILFPRVFGTDSGQTPQPKILFAIPANQNLGIIFG